MHLVLRVGDLARQDAGLAGLRFVLLPLGRRELVSALRADGDSRRRSPPGTRGTPWPAPRRCRDPRVTTWIWSTGPCRSTLPPKSRTRQFCFAGMQAESPPDHLVIQPRRHRRSHQRHAVDVRRVEAGGQDVHVAEVLQFAAPEPAQAWRPARESASRRRHEPALHPVLGDRASRRCAARASRRVAKIRQVWRLGRVLDDLGAGRLHQRRPGPSGLRLRRR